MRVLRAVWPMAKKKRVVCVCCGVEGTHGGRGLRSTCYWRHSRDGTLDQFPTVKRNTDWQCDYCHSQTGKRCQFERRRRSPNGPYNHHYCKMHAWRHYQHLNMDAPHQAQDRSGNPKCRHVFANGQPCGEDREVDRKTGHFVSPYCVLHRSRRYLGIDMDAPVPAPPREVLIVRNGPYAFQGAHPRTPAGEGAD